MNGHTTGALNYLSESVKPSLFRNGAVYTKRDADGSDSETVGLVLDKVDCRIQNARQLTGSAALTLRANGFELFEAPLNPLDFLSHEQVVSRYYPQCAEIVEQQTGGRAIAFDHNVRSATAKQSNQQIRGGQAVQAPIHIIHGDYTLASAPQRLRDLTNKPSRNDTFQSSLREARSLLAPEAAKHALEGGRYAIINVWRNIAAEPVAVKPLALCDSRSVSRDDLVVFEIHYEDRIGENYFARHSPEHRWFYYPQMTPKEALLIKQWDSAGTFARSGGDQSDGTTDEGPGTFSFHTAFKDPKSKPEAPDRWSIEVRCMVLYD